MQLPDFERAKKLASKLTVLDQDSGAYVPIILSLEQEAVLRELCRGRRRLVVGKGRQVGISTICVFFGMLLALLNPGLPLVTAADDQKGADKLLAKVKHWLLELGQAIGKLTTVDNMRTLELVNGAVYESLTAISHAAGGESRTGRGSSYGFIHGSEVGLWREAPAVWAALTATALGQAIWVVESTGAPGESLFKALVEGAKPASEEVPVDSWALVFLSVEDHALYQRDPAELLDPTWEKLQADYGFSSRPHAAWWWKKLVDDFKGDVFRMLREYPVRVAHMFVFREGQHIRTWKETEAREADKWTDVYVEQENIHEPVVLGVDTSKGVGLDASSIAAIGQRTGRVLATYRRNDIPPPAFVDEVKAWVARYRPVATVIESNGVGGSVWRELALSAAANAVEQKSGEWNGELNWRRELFREAIERGEVLVGGHFLKEIRHSLVDKRGKFVGTDDVISAASFAWVWRRENPWIEPVEEVDHREVFVPKNRRRARVTV